MNADKIMDSIRAALGNPQSGTIADAMPLIEAGVLDALGEGAPKETPTPTKADTRVVKAKETR